MPSTKSCPRCGSTSEGEWSGGMCPACLLEHGWLGFGPSPISDSTALDDPTSRVALGQRFGDYELIEELSAGGMGIVYRARQRSLNRVVAVKMIRAGHLARTADIRRFRTEAEAAAKLQHPNIVAIYEVGEHDGQHFFSMEFVDGKSLAELVREHPMEPRAAARCVRAVAEAIEYAHVRGVLHRDLKPSNVMVGPDETPRVTDFGLAKLSGDSELTQPGAVLGSPGYMPPEQALGRAAEIGVRSDVYALGGILYELLTGSPPFRAATPLETLKLVIEAEPVPPRQLNPRLPRDLDIICAKCLEKLPARRYGTARELADELGRFLEDQPIHARPTGQAEKLWRWCRRKPGLAASLALSFLLLAALAAVSTTTAARLRKESEQTQSARREAEDKLWSAYVAQARAGRLSGVAGRRSQSLAAVTAAARMKASLELRNEAIACLALSDLGETRPWRGFPGVERNQMVAWDANLEYCAAELEPGHLIVARAGGHAPAMELRLTRAKVRYGEFSADGNYFAANAADGRARVWAINPSAPLTNVALPLTPNQPSLLAFHPDSRWLVLIGRNQQLHGIDVVAGVKRAPVHLDAMPNYLAIAPDGRQLALAVGREIHCLSWPKLERLKTFKHGAMVTCLAWHPDGRRVVAGDWSGGLIGWDPETGGYITLPAHGQYVSWVDFHPQGEIVVSHGWDGLSRFWDSGTARQLFATATGLATKFSRDGRQLAFHQEAGEFGLWEFVRSDCFRQLSPPLALSGADVSPDGRWIVYTDPVGWHLWNLVEDRAGPSVALPAARWPAFLPDGDGLVALTPDAVMRWPLTTNSVGTNELVVGPAQTLVSLPGIDFQRLGLSIDGGRIAVAGRFRSVVVGSKEPLRPVEFARNMSEANVTISPDYQSIVTTTHNGRGAVLWNAAGAQVRVLLTNENSLAAFSVDGRSLVTTTSRECSFWDTATWQVQRRLHLGLGSAVPGPIAFSRDGRLLAVAGNRRDIKLLNPETGDEFASLTAPEAQNLTRIAFSADGSRLVATAINRSIQIWDLRALRRQLAGLGLDWQEGTGRRLSAK